MSEFGGDAFSSILIACCGIPQKGLSTVRLNHTAGVEPAYHMRNFTHYALDESATVAISAEHLIRTTFAQTPVAGSSLNLACWTVNLPTFQFKLSHYRSSHRAAGCLAVGLSQISL